jgi:hypothetical protein
LGGARLAEAGEGGGGVAGCEHRVHKHEQALGEPKTGRFSTPRAEPFQRGHYSRGLTP